MKNSQALVLLSSIKLALATFISRVLGLVRELLIARFFGASGMTDAFYVAYRIPNLLRDLFAEGGFSAAFVPIFTEAKVENDEESKLRLFRSAFWSLFLVTSLFSVLIFFLSENLVTWFAPSFVDDPEKFDLTVSMVKIVAPFLFFISLAALLMGVLNTHKVFFLPAVTPAFLNVSVITSILFLTDYFVKKEMPGIYSVAVGILVGGSLQFLLQVPKTISLGFKFVPTFTLLTPRVKKILKKMGPGLVGFSVNQINLLVNTILATGAGVGAVSWLNYGFRLFQFPSGVLAVSLGSSHLVYFADAWKKGQKEEAKKIFQSTLTTSLALLVPVAFITLYYSDWIVSLIFEGGKFTSKDTSKAAVALSLYALAIPLEGIKKITIPLFYSVDKEKVQVGISIFAILFNITIAYSFMNHFSFKGEYESLNEFKYALLALSLSLSSFLSISIQLAYLKKFLQLNWSSFINPRTLKIVIIGILAPYGGSKFFKPDWFFQIGKLKQLLLFISVASALLSLFAVLLVILGEREILDKVLKKLKKK